MRQPAEPSKPGQEVRSSLRWQDDDAIRPGARVEGTDGTLGTVRERRVGAGPEQAYLGVDTDEGLIYVPERLVRETRGATVVLSLPVADAKAQGSHDTLPVQERADRLPHEP
jgi:hypothetical protein